MTLKFWFSSYHNPVRIGLLIGVNHIQCFQCFISMYWIFAFWIKFVLGVINPHAYEMLYNLFLSVSSSLSLRRKFTSLEIDLFCWWLSCHLSFRMFYRHLSLPFVGVCRWEKCSCKYESVVLVWNNKNVFGLGILLRVRDCDDPVCCKTNFYLPLGIY